MDNQLKWLQCKLPKEQQRGDEQPYKSTFVLGYFNGDSNCVLVAKHKNNNAFEDYHEHHLSTESFNEWVGGKDVNVVLN